MPHKTLLPTMFVFMIPGFAQVPTFEISEVKSAIQFQVKSSVDLEGVFKKWNATLTFKSTDVQTGVLNIVIQADSVDSGSGMKDSKLKGEDFFDVKHNPNITFKSKKFVPLGDLKFRIEGDFTIRGVTKQESLLLTVVKDNDHEGSIKGQMAFDRKDYGMNHNIPFIKIADRVQVTIDMRGRRVSGPPLNLQPTGAAQ